jgi:hypothetical protein
VLQRHRTVVGLKGTIIKHFKKIWYYSVSLPYSFYASACPPFEDLDKLTTTTSRVVTHHRLLAATAAPLPTVTAINISDVYEKSLAHSSGAVKVNKNSIDPDFRAAGWGLAGLTCLVSFLLITWTFHNKRDRVMQAFQPFLLLQCAIGLFFLGATNVQLGFDDSLFGDNILDITCLTTPWIYVFGFSLFYSSVYSKITMCIKIFKDSDKYEVMVVQPMDSVKFF